MVSWAKWKISLISTPAFGHRTQIRAQIPRWVTAVPSSWLRNGGILFQRILVLKVGVSRVPEGASPAAAGQAGTRWMREVPPGGSLVPRKGWVLCQSWKCPIHFGTVKYGRCGQKKTHKVQTFYPFSWPPSAMTDLLSVVSDFNHHTAELFILIHSGIQFKTSCVQLYFLKIEFFSPSLALHNRNCGCVALQSWCSGNKGDCTSGWNLTVGLSPSTFMVLQNVVHSFLTSLFAQCSLGSLMELCIKF